MDEIEVTTTPLDLSAALFTGAAAGGGGVYRIQNRGPGTVYRTTTPPGMAPVPGAVRGWRHPQGDEVAVAIFSGPLDPHTWVWTSSDRATLLVEPNVE